MKRCAWGIFLLCMGCSSALYRPLKSPQPLTSSTYPLLRTVPPRTEPYPAQEVQRVRQGLEQNADKLRTRSTKTSPQ